MPITENLELAELAAAVSPHAVAPRPSLERLFLHDLLNTAAGLHVLASLFASGALPDAQLAESKVLFSDLAANLVDDIQHQRELLQAERGELALRIEEIDLRPFLENLRRVCSRTVVGKNRQLRLAQVPDAVVYSDAVLVRRSIVNLIKNAAEATAAGGVITLTCQLAPGAVRFLVHNPGSMDDLVRQQIFRRPFSTKTGGDRGLGTYSVKLFVERYLSGHVECASSEADGTVVSFQIPDLRG